MNLFEQSFSLIHKNKKIMLILLVHGLIQNLFFLKIDLNSLEGILISVLFGLLTLVAQIIAIGWSNEAFETGGIQGPILKYIGFIVKYLIQKVIILFVLISVNFGFVYTLIKDVPGAMNWKNIQMVTDFITAHEFTLFAIVLINLLLGALFAFAAYALIIDKKGIGHAFKQSILYSFKGLIVGFFSGLGIIGIFLAGGSIISHIFLFNTMIQTIILSAITAYGEAVFTAFMVGLYHKLNKSA